MTSKGNCPLQPLLLSYDWEIDGMFLVSSRYLKHLSSPCEGHEVEMTKTFVNENAPIFVHLLLLATVCLCQKNNLILMDYH